MRARWSARAPRATAARAGACRRRSTLKRALELALRAALERGDRHIGTVHVLLGLCRCEDPGLRATLARVGTTPGALAAAVLAEADRRDWDGGRPAAPARPSGTTIAALALRHRPELHGRNHGGALVAAAPRPTRCSTGSRQRTSRRPRRRATTTTSGCPASGFLTVKLRDDKVEAKRSEADFGRRRHPARRSAAARSGRSGASRSRRCVLHGLTRPTAR